MEIKCSVVRGLPPFVVKFEGVLESAKEQIWKWDFGDGTTGEGIKIEHTYTTPGDMLVVATATDAGDVVTTASVYVTSVGNIVLKDDVLIDTYDMISGGQNFHVNKYQSLNEYRKEMVKEILIPFTPEGGGSETPTDPYTVKLDMILNNQDTILENQATVLLDLVKIKASLKIS